MAMLDQLLTDTLDPGYRAAAKRPTRKRWYDGPLVWAGCAAVGLLLVMSYDQSHRSEPARAAARKELIDRIHSVGKARDQLEHLASQLANDVSRLRDAQLSGTQTGLGELEVDAGSVPVTGPGIVVRLSEPPKSSQSPAPGSGPVVPVGAAIHDTDIRAVVNVLWAAGAEAISVNGIRLTPTSAIRFAGESVLVDFQPINSPYEIDAIGSRTNLQVQFAESAVAAALKTKEDVEGIGFDFSGKARLTLASANVTRPRFAGRGATASPSANPSESPR